MSVVSFDEIHDGRDGGDELQRDGRMISRYTRVFRAITDSATDEAAVVLAYADCPRVGSIYTPDPRAYCQRVRPRQESFAKIVWIVTASYSSERELEEDPLNEPAAISWSTASYTRPVYKHRAGPNAGKLIVNAANRPPNPPIEDDDSHWGANVRKNVISVPAWLGAYRNAINSTAFFLDGYAFGARMAKMNAMEVSEWQERNGVNFKVLTMRIDLNEETWVRSMQNDGMEDINGKPCEDDKGQPVTEPTPLTAAGMQLPWPIVLANVNFYDAYTCYERNFKLLPLT